MAVTNRTHSPTPEELMAFADGESPAEARPAIEAHVASCEECRRLIGNLRGVNRATALWAVEEAPSALQPPRIRRSRSWAMRPLSWRPGYVVISAGGIAAIALLVANLGTYATRTRSAAGVTTAVAHARETSLPVVPGDQIRTNGALDGRLDRNGPATRAEIAASLERFTETMKAPNTAPADPQSVVPRQPSVIRTATLRLIAKDFESARGRVEAIVAQAGGFLDQIALNGTAGTARTLTGTLRLPASRLADALARLRQLGQVTEDTQNTEDVTDQIVDLDARLVNARATEQRLNDILKNRTGKLSDVLDVERELARVRLEIERMDAERVNIGRRVTYAAITLEIGEERKAGLEAGPLSLGTRLRVAAADGLEAALESVVGAVLLALRAGPATIIWVGLGATLWVLGRQRVQRAQRVTEESPRRPLC